MVRAEGFEPSRAVTHRILSPARLPIPPHPHTHTRHVRSCTMNASIIGNSMVGHEGIEPSTPRLKGGCSTPELMAHNVAGAAGFEPAKCRLQRPMPYRLATPQYFCVLVRPAGFEPAAFRFVVCGSIRAELRALATPRVRDEANIRNWGE